MANKEAHEAASERVWYRRPHTLAIGALGLTVGADAAALAGSQTTSRRARRDRESGSGRSGPGAEQG
jgi:hypothetical protein